MDQKEQILESWKVGLEEGLLERENRSLMDQ